MTVDFNSSNTTRYYTSPDSSDLTLPNADWTWLLVGSVKTVSSNSYGISTNTILAANSFNISLVTTGQVYAFYNGVTNTTTAAVSVNNPFIIGCRRTGNLLDTFLINIGSSTVSKSTAANVAGSSSNGTGLWLATRNDLEPTRMWDGPIEHVILGKNKAISDAELIALANGVPMDQTEFWNNRVFHAYLEESTAPQITDLIGGKILTQTGTGFGSKVEGLDVKLYSDRRKIYFLPMFEAAVGGGFQAAWAYRTNTLIGGL